MSSIEQTRFKNVPEQEMLQNVMTWQPGQLAVWIADLPLQPQHACRKICSALHQLNQTSISIEVRKSYFEIFAQKLFSLDKQIERGYLNASVLLSREKREQVEWLIWSDMRLVRGIQLGLDSIEDEEGRLGLISLAMHVLARALQHISSLYFDPNDDYWRLCYWFYQLAEKEGLLDFKRLSDAGDCNYTPLQVFKAIVLYAVSDFRQFRPTEMRQIFQLFCKHPEYLDIKVDLGAEYVEKLYVLDLSNGESPKKFFQKGDLSSEHRLLDFSVAPALLMALVNSGDIKKEVGEIEPHVVVRVAKALAQVNKRRFKRQEDKGKVSAIAGLQYFLDYVNQIEKKRGPITLPESLMPGFEYSTEHFELVKEGEEFIYEMNNSLVENAGADQKVQNIFVSGNQLSKASWTDAIDGSQPESISPADYGKLNSGAKGFGLSAKFNVVNALIGELFFIVREDHSFEIGVVRHIHRLENERLYLGVELLGISSGLADIQLKTKSEVKTTGVLLPELKAIKQPNTIIINSRDFKEGDFITLTSGTQKRSCRINNKINSTSYFKQFEVSFLQL